MVRVRVRVKVRRGRSNHAQLRAAEHEAGEVDLAGAFPAHIASTARVSVTVRVRARIGDR